MSSPFYVAARPPSRLLWFFLGAAAMFLSLAAVVVLIAGRFAYSRTNDAPAPTQRSACIINLRMIEGAKSTWALEQRKSALDVPVDSELFGESHYIQEKPMCPARGSYSLNPVGQAPTCSMPGHALEDRNLARRDPEVVDEVSRILKETR